MTTPNQEDRLPGDPSRAARVPPALRLPGRGEAGAPHAAGRLLLKNSRIPEAIQETEPQTNLETGHCITAASSHSCPPARHRGTGQGAGSTHQLRRLPEPGAQAAELAGSFAGRGQGPAGERDDAAAGAAGPAGAAVVGWAEQPLAAGGRAHLRSEATADLEREREVGSEGKPKLWQTLAKRAGELAVLAQQELCQGAGTEPPLPTGLRRHMRHSPSEWRPQRCRSRAARALCVYSSAECPQPRQQHMVGISSPPQAGAQAGAKQDLSPNSSWRVCIEQTSRSLSGQQLVPSWQGKLSNLYSLLWEREWDERTLPSCLDSSGFNCTASSSITTHQGAPCRRGTCRPGARASTSTGWSLGNVLVPWKAEGEAGGLHSNHALGDTEMDLHGNNKAAKEK